MSQAMNNIEVFSHIPQDLKFELFVSTLGSVDIFKRYCQALVMPVAEMTALINLSII